MVTNNDKFDYIINYIAKRQMAKDLLDKIEWKGNKKMLLLTAMWKLHKIQNLQIRVWKKKVFGHLIKVLGGGMFMILILATEILYLSFNQ